MRAVLVLLTIMRIMTMMWVERYLSLQYCVLVL